MRLYKVLNFNYGDGMSDALNTFAKEGFVVKFFTQSEDPSSIHCTAVLEKELNDALPR